ncbi:MAG: DUF2155 domain-containing protein [Aliidongia sp.]
MFRPAVLAMVLGLGAVIAATAWAATTKPKPPADVKPAPEAPAPEIISGAELQALDKISARVTKFSVPFGQAVNFGTLSISVKDCRRTPPEEEPETAAFLDIEEYRPGGATPQKLFHGWMFASSPALNPLEHPVYDLWVLDCTTSTASPAKPG